MGGAEDEVAVGGGGRESGVGEVGGGDVAGGVGIAGGWGWTGRLVGGGLRSEGGRQGGEQAEGEDNAEAQHGELYHCVPAGSGGCGQGRGGGEVLATPGGSAAGSGATGGFGELEVDTYAFSVDEDDAGVE